MTVEKQFRETAKQVLAHPALKIYSSAPRSFTLPRGIAGNLQLANELSQWNSKALSAALSGFAGGALTTRSIQGGAVGAIGKGITKASTYLFENKEEIYNRVKRAYQTGEVSLTLPFDDVINATRDGKLLDTVYGIVDGKIKAYSFADNIKSVPGGILVVPNSFGDTNERQQKEKR